MKITREFAPADRYLYDFGLCSYANGWAQVDTAQDASYFGTWANPTRLLIFNYCEGDTTLHEAETPEEFADPRQFNPFSTLARPWVQTRKVIGILDKRAPPEFRFNNFVLISLPVFSVASTGSIGKRCLFPE